MARSKRFRCMISVVFSKSFLFLSRSAKRFSSFSGDDISSTYLRIAEVDSFSRSLSSFSLSRISFKSAKILIISEANPSRSSQVSGVIAVSTGVSESSGSTATLQLVYVLHKNPLSVFNFSSNTPRRSGSSNWKSKMPHNFFTS